MEFPVKLNTYGPTGRNVMSAAPLLPLPILGVDPRSLPIGPREAFVLSQIDGVAGVAELSAGTGFDEDTVIDCGVGGNVSGFINHSCDPNCETVDDDGRIFVEALRDLQVGEELVYDYRLTWEDSDDFGDLSVYVCRCGSQSCRGTMLDVEPLMAAS